jgi:hypothetical protein
VYIGEEFAKEKAVLKELTWMYVIEEPALHGSNLASWAR